MANMGRCKVDHLVVDSGAFIRNIEIKDIGQKIYCVREVVNEIRDKATRQRLQVLPYDITFREPTPEAYHAVVEFSKKTGDFVSLSAVDLRVLALAYQLEKENVGTEHIRHGPVHKAEVWETNRNFDNPAQIAGFYLGPKKTNQKSSKSGTSSVRGNEIGQSEGDSSENSKNKVVADDKPETETELSNKNDEVDDDKMKQDGDRNEENNVDENKQENDEDKNEDKCRYGDDEVEENQGKDNDEIKDNKSDENKGDANNRDDSKDKNEVDDKRKNQDDSEYRSQDDCPGNSQDDCHGNSQDDCDGNSQDDCHGNSQDDDENAEEEEEDDDGGWVTPDNIAAVLMESNLLDVKPAQVVPVACLTTDFAMQNVLLQMGLNVLSVDGMLIKRAKSYVLRCYGCFKVITDMTKRVCPRCGYSTLRKVSMTVNDDGSVQYYLSNRKPVRTRALQHPPPMPKSGKHTNNYQQTKHSQAKHDVFNLDNITLDSPFAMNSLNRPSANIRFKGQNRGYRK